jgi:hypothetical protein
LSVAVTPDGQYVVSGSDGQNGAVVGVGDGERSAAVHGARGLGQERRGDADGKYVVSGAGSSFFSNADKTVRVWYIGDLLTPGK